MAEAGTGRAAAHARFRQYVGRIARPLSHPFLLLVVGALLTSLLLPWITRSWQDHQRQLDLQDELVSEITRETTRYIDAAHRARDEPAFQESSALAAWRVERAVIQSRLSAYYPTGDNPPDDNRPPEIADQWLHYVNAGDAFYRFAIRPKRRHPRLCSELRIAALPTCDPSSTSAIRCPRCFHDAVMLMENGLSLLVSHILKESPRV